MDRFEDMRTFVRVVEAGSISQAAERMNLAKSAVSRRITELENRLGVQLFRRTTRKLNLTATGRSFYARCVRLLADLEEAELAVSQEHGTLQGILRVAAPLSFGLLHLGAAITDFMAAHPKVTFELDFNDRQVDLLQEEVDVAIRIARLSDSSFIARRLAPIRALACASPEYLARRGAPHTPLELRQHPCLVYSNAPEIGLWRYQDQDGKEGSIRVPAYLQANNGDFLRQAAIAGQGILLGPTFILYQALAQKQLIPILTDYTWPILNVYALYPQTRHLSQRVRAFVDFLAARFAGTPYWELKAGHLPP